MRLTLNATPQSAATPRPQPPVRAAGAPPSPPATPAAPAAATTSLVADHANSNQPLAEITNINPSPKPKTSKPRKPHLSMVKDVPKGYTVTRWENDRTSDGAQNAEQVLIEFLQEETHWKDFWLGTGGIKKSTVAALALQRLWDHGCDQYRREKSVLDKIGNFNDGYRKWNEWKEQTGNGLDEASASVIAYKDKTCRYYDILVDLIGPKNAAHQPAGMHSTGDAADAIIDGLEKELDHQDGGSPAWETAVEDDEGDEEDETQGYETLADALRQFQESQPQSQPLQTPLRSLPLAAPSTPSTPTPGSGPLTLKATGARVERKKQAGMTEVLREGNEARMNLKRELHSSEMDLRREAFELERKKARVEEERLDAERKSVKATRYTAWTSALASLVSAGISPTAAMEMLGPRPDDD